MLWRSRVYASAVVTSATVRSCSWHQASHIVYSTFTVTTAEKDAAHRQTYHFSNYHVYIVRLPDNITKVWTCVNYLVIYLFIYLLFVCLFVCYLMKKLKDRMCEFLWGFAKVWALWTPCVTYFFIEHRHVTDGQMDRRTDIRWQHRGLYRASISLRGKSVEHHFANTL